MTSVSGSTFQWVKIKAQAFKYLISLIALMAVLLPLNSANAEDLLEVDDAFVLFEPKLENQQIIVEWKIAKNYKLYKDKMAFSATQIELAAPKFSKTEVIDDPLFGKTEVFTNKAIATLAFSGSAQTTKLTIKYQGCDTVVGVCYPPQTRTFSIDLPASVNSTENNNIQAQQNSSSFSSLSALDKFFKQDSSQPELLDAEEAFKFSHNINANGQLEFNWQVAPDYHLYKDKLKTRVLNGDIELGALNLPPAEMIDDELFGRTAVYHGNMQAVLPVSSITGNALIEVEYQGCSAASGVCYPPIKKQIKVNANDITTSANSATSNNPLSANARVTENSAENSSLTTSTALSETDQITATLQNSSVWIVIITFFIFGLLLAFTPCVFPMIPILSSIIAGQGDQITTRKAFTMSLVYVLAMSITYTLAGVLAGLFGENLQAAFQNPWILGTFSMVFVLLALSMFGFYELQLPSSLQSKITNLSNKQQGGTLTGVAIMGFLSALIVGPCVAPPLAGALIYIGQTGDAWLGGTALFAMSMGMGVPLLLLGTSAGKLLPKAGAWMDTIKAIFGVMLLGVAIWMLERVIPAELTMLSWALLLIISAVYMGAFSNSDGKSGWLKLSRGLAIVMFIYGSMILVGLLGGSNQVLQPLKVFQGGAITSNQQTSDKLAFKTIKSYDDLQAEIAKGQPIMLDFYADWCVSCKEMEAFTFTKPQVHAALKGVTLLKANVTANDEIDKALMKQFGIIGPPAILFFNEQGQEQRAQRVIGFQKADKFTANINNAFK